MVNIILSHGYITFKLSNVPFANISKKHTKDSFVTLRYDRKDEYIEYEMIITQKDVEHIEAKIFDSLRWSFPSYKIYKSDKSRSVPLYNLCNGTVIFNKDKRCKFPRIENGKLVTSIHPLVSDGGNSSFRGYANVEVTVHYIVDGDVLRWLDMLLVGIFDNDTSDLVYTGDGVFPDWILDGKDGVDGITADDIEAYMDRM